ncbi:MAG: radical SAM protein [Actinomycetota bacterium]
MGPGLKNIFWPPSMIARQAASMVLFKNVAGWKKMGGWFASYGIKSLPVAAGAIGMGCIGFPAHPAWEVTNACNLNCIHCHTHGGGRLKDELSTRDAKKFIDQLAKISEFRMLVYTGGEPMVRNDIFDLLAHSQKAGFVNVIATNGTLITPDTAARLKRAGVAGIAVSLDSADPRINNKIRNSSRAYDEALRGIKAVKEANILLQVNTTVMEYNFDRLDELIHLVDGFGTAIMLMYQLVPVGRGGDIRDAALSRENNGRLLRFLAEVQKNSSAVIEPVAGPQYWAYLLEKSGKNSRKWIRAAEKLFHGCSAGRGLLYIKANGELWPCPFVETSLGNVREDDVSKVWRKNELLKKLRNRETLKGRCADCRYKGICGGCRGRALAFSRDLFAEDSSCFLDFR